VMCWSPGRKVDPYSHRGASLALPRPSEASPKPSSDRCAVVAAVTCVRVHYFLCRLA